MLDDKIPRNVLMGFATECSEDYRTLMEMVKSRQMRVTIYNIEGGQLKNRRPSQAQALIDRGVVSCLEDAVSTLIVSPSISPPPGSSLSPFLSARIFFCDKLFYCHSFVYTRSNVLTQ